MDGSTDVVLVNDLESLILAVEDLNNLDRMDGLNNPAGYSSVEVIQTFVPRLIKSYEDVLEASFELTRLVELMNQNRTPEGLYLP